MECSPVLELKESFLKFGLNSSTDTSLSGKNFSLLLFSLFETHNSKKQSVIGLKVSFVLFGGDSNVDTELTPSLRNPETTILLWLHLDISTNDWI